MTVRVIDNATARRIFLDRHLLLQPPTGPAGAQDVAALIRKLGFVQLDSVLTFARAHDLILWSRKQRYKPSVLDQVLKRDRAVFEHWTHDASAIDMEAFPHWKLKFSRERARLAERWAKWRDEEFLGQIDTVREQIAVHGPASSRDVGEGEERKSGGWWDWHPSKTALEYLWRTGELSVTRREGFRKVYDLTERVIPAELLRRRYHQAETIEWACSTALDKLGFATSTELADFYDLIGKDEARQWCSDALARGEIEPVDVIGAGGQAKRCFARPAGDLPIPDPSVSARVRILSPFDPALRDRKRAEWLFGFRYRIEIFVPEAKRTYGYYVFPVLEGTRLIGRIDMKIDRTADALVVRAYWPELGAQHGKGRQARLEAELDRARRFAAVSRVAFEENWLR
jgi:uncharacterized protein YcaQ